MGTMAEINKLSVEKALNKLRANAAVQSKGARLNEKWANSTKKQSE